jgi:hypothetical protein
MKFQTQLELLSRMGSSGRAESESPEVFCRMFYPPKEQLGALDPDVTLILGPRGSGKTALFRAVTEFDLTETLREQNPKARIQPNCLWHPVELYSKRFPNQAQLRSFFENENLTEDQTQDFWQGILVRSLWGHLDTRDKEELVVLDKAETNPAALLQASQKIAIQAATALDHLDDRLETAGRILFVGFDELDLLVHRNGRAAATLVGFWASRWRRWKGIRAKLFLRSDIYRRFVNEGGADLAKLAANRFELKWSDEALLAMLVKRILNTNLAVWRKTLRLTSKRDVVDHPVLGAVLASNALSDLHGVVHAILGPYMGANRKKGASEKWILDHIKDCQGNASPRSLVRMLEQAAERQLTERFEGDVVLDPAFVRQSLTAVSIDHLQSSLEEWPWLHGLSVRLSRWTGLRIMPMERKPFEVQLRKSWSEPWSQKVEFAEPPCDDPQGFVPMLIDAGILRERKDGKLETTDLYLDGLGFKRKGGVRRRILKAKS